MCDPNLMPMYDGSSNLADNNASYYSNLQPLQQQNQHHQQALPRAVSYEPISQSQDHIMQQLPTQKSQVYDDSYQHDQYSGVQQPQQQQKVATYSGLQVQNLVQDQSYHSQNMHNRSGISMSHTQQPYHNQITQNYAVQAMQPQLQSQRHPTSWTPQIAQHQQNTISYGRQPTSLESQQLPYDSYVNTSHQQPQSASYANSDHNQRMLITGNVLPQHQDSQQISHDNFQQFYQIQQHQPAQSQQHRSMYGQQSQQQFKAYSDNQVYGQNKANQINYQLKPEMHIEVGNDTATTTQLMSMPDNYRTIMQNEDVSLPVANDGQDRQFHQNISAIQRYPGFQNKQETNVSQYTRQLQHAQPYFGQDSEATGHKVAAADGYTTTEAQELHRLRQGYFNPNQLQQVKQKLYNQQYGYQSQHNKHNNLQVTHPVPTHQPRQQFHQYSQQQVRQHAEYQQRQITRPGTQSTSTHNMTDNAQRSTASNYQPTVVLSHSGRVKGSRPLATVLTKNLSNRQSKNRHGDSSSDDEVVSHFSPQVDSPTVTRRSLRQRKQKTYNEDFDYNITDEEEDNKRRETSPSKAGSPLQEDNAPEEEALVVDKILSVRTTKGNGEEYPEELEEFFVKYKNYSYLHAEWATTEKLLRGDKRINMKIKRYKHKRSKLGYLAELEDDEPFNPEYVEVDRVLDVKTYQDPKTKECTTHCLVKWKSLPYEDSTWEIQDNIRKEKIEEMYRINNRPPINPRMVYYRPHPSEWMKLPSSPKYKAGNVLRDYQLEGLNWLLFCWFNRQNSILADEMGLGKTIQSLAFLDYLKKYNILGPFLVIAPLSTIANWQREFEAWIDLNVVVYHGSSASRQLIQEYELYHRDSNGVPNPNAVKFQIIITTYEIILADNPDLRSIPWRAVIIDEAHRLKNRHCKLLEGLKLLHMDQRILLTGTPLQNNVEELFSLLNFLEPARFSSDVLFMSEFGNLKTEAQVEKLQALLKPMMLRRLKEDVEKNLAPKEETIIEVELTTIQKKFYRAILEKNLNFLSKGASGSNLPNLMNTMMELRKCCNHPFLINGAEEKIVGEFTANNQLNGRNAATLAMIQASGKLVLIDKLLPKLKAGGHKVLVFSQMVRCLDILEDYLMYRRYQYERIDGRVRGNLRQAAIDRFCKPDSDRFVFLLCTRAGGLGINLTAADTVLIFDSDWNPQNDLQAQARCHRIGQDKAVKVYRLITRNSYEREMFDRASLKLGLDRAVLQPMSGSKETVPTQELSKKEVEDLLRKGAYGALMEEDNDDVSNKFCEEDIDQILERRTQVIHIDSEGKGSTFAKASFVSSGDNDDIDIDDPNFWQKWAQKAQLDVEDGKAAGGLILNEPRQRRQTKRYGTDDSIYDISDEDLDPDYTPKKQVGWSRVECFRVEKYLLTYGWGRWKDILRVARFKRKLLEKDIEAISRTILLYCIQCYRGDDKLKDFILAIVSSSDTGTTRAIAAGPIGRGRRGRKAKNASKNQDSVEISSTNKLKLKNNPDVLLQDEGYKKHLRHHCNKILLRIRLLYYLRFDIANDIVEDVFFGTVASDIQLHIPPTEGDPPCTWWNKEADKSLLIGVLKHGYEKYDLVVADPALYFFDRVEPTTVQDKPATKDSYDDMDDIDNDDSPSLKSPKRKKEYQQPESTLHDGKLGWPSASDLNTRLRRLITAYQRSHKKQQLKQAAAEKERERKERFEEAIRQKELKKMEMASRWSKREEVDFYRVVSTFGVEYNPETGNYDWEKFRQLARLDKKADEKLTKYYIGFMDMCKNVCNKTNNESSDSANFSIDPISREKASRCMRRVELLNTIRCNVLLHSKLDERLALAQPSNDLPSWWICGYHDKDVLIGVSQHGISRIEYNLCNDPSLSFARVPTLSSTLPKAATVQSPIPASAAANDENLTEVSIIPNPLFGAPAEDERDLRDITDANNEQITENNEWTDTAIKNSLEEVTLQNSVLNDDDDQVFTINQELKPDIDSRVSPPASINVDNNELERTKGENCKSGNMSSKSDKWPKDKVIIRRLERLCECVTKGVWPTSITQPSSPLEDNEGANADDDFAANRFKVRRVSALKVTITNKKSKRGRKPKKDLPQLATEGKKRKSKGKGKVRQEVVTNKDERKADSLPHPPTKRKRKLKTKESKEQHSAPPKKRGRKPGKSKKNTKAAAVHKEPSSALSSLVGEFTTEPITADTSLYQPPSYMSPNHSAFSLRDEESYGCEGDTSMFNTNLSEPSPDQVAPVENTTTSQNKTDSDDMSMTRITSARSFDSVNEEQYEGERLQDFTGSLYDSHSPSLNIHDDILTSCHNSPGSAPEELFDVALLHTNEPVLDPSHKIVYDTADN